MSDKIVFGYREEIYREVIVEGKSLEDMKKIFENIIDDRDLGSVTVEDVAKDNKLTVSHNVNDYREEECSYVESQQHLDKFYVPYTTEILFEL